MRRALFWSLAVPFTAVVGTALFFYGVASWAAERPWR